MDINVTHAVVFTSVVLARFIVPLFILRYPLPAIIAALVIDAVDQTVFQIFTDSELKGYQSYDKALDVYYLAIAYIATMRNWTNIAAYQAGRFLWYYRLAGATLFELVGWRPLLLIFPNTFEYFFIAIEGVRTRWSMRRLSKENVLAVAAFIWIVIKLPQEAWIHVFQFDVTDAFKKRVLGTPLDASWGEAFGNNLWIFPVLLVIVAAAWLGIRWVARRLPPGDWAPTIDANENVDDLARVELRPRAERHWREGLAEKLVLVALISVIFAQMLPNVHVRPLQMIIGVSVVVIANAVISHWLAARGTHWRSTATEFASLAAINLGIGVLYILIMPSFGAEVGRIGLLFFTFLLTLIITLYDRYRPVIDALMEAEAALAARATVSRPAEEPGVPA